MIVQLRAILNRRLPPATKRHLFYERQPRQRLDGMRYISPASR